MLDHAISTAKRKLHMVSPTRLDLAALLWMQGRAREKSPRTIARLAHLAFSLD
jgi:hypothetical protein